MELEQDNDKPLFYAVLSIPVNIPIFNDGNPYHEKRQKTF